jgi:hypothetical protein
MAFTTKVTAPSSHYVAEETGAEEDRAENQVWQRTWHMDNIIFLTRAEKE